MGLNLTNPKELDWMARGRKEGPPTFEESHPENQRRQQAYEELIQYIGIVLRSRAEDGDQRSQDELQKAAEGILSTISADEKLRIGERIWDDLSNSDAVSERFSEVYWKSFAKELVDHWEENYRKSKKDRMQAGMANS